MEDKFFFTAIFTTSYILGLAAFYNSEGFCFALFVTIICIIIALSGRLRPALAFCIFFIFFFGFYNAGLQSKKSDAFSSVLRANDTKAIGRIYTIPSVSEEKSRGRFFIKVYKAEVFGYDIESKGSNLLVTITDTKENIKKLRAGEIIELKGKLRQPRPVSNESEFDYKRYLLNKDTFDILYVEACDYKVISKPDIKNANSKIKEIWWNSIYNLDILREKIILKHKKYIKSPCLEVFGGVVFGDDAVNPPDEVKQSFINSGLLHLLAASGLNVALIFGIWFALAGFLKLPYKLNLSIGIGIVILYTFMTGFPPPILRASIMLLLVLTGKLMFKASDNLTLIFFTGFILLLFQPKLLNDVGFELSFLVTGGLLTCVEPVCGKFSEADRKFKSRFSKFPSLIQSIIFCFSPIALIGMITVPLVAQIWAAPLQMYYFNTFSTCSIFANIAVVPFIGIISFTGFVSSIFALLPVFGDFIVKICAYILNPFIKILLIISDFFSKIPYSIIKTPSPSAFQIVLYYIFILNLAFCIRESFKRKRANLCALGLILLLLISFIRPSNDNFEITVFDVQNADSILIKTPKNKFIIIDTGRLAFRGISSARKIILEYLYDKNIREIEDLILTHFDIDHTGGTIDLIENVKINNIILQNNTCDTENSCRILDKIKEKGLKFDVAKNNNIIYKEENFEIKTFKAEIKEGAINKIENENSIITLISFKDKKALFMGDAGVDAIRELKNKIGVIDIIKIGHHGAKGVIDKESLNSLKPHYAIISTGFNPYGHPDKRTIETLENFGTKIYSTKELGQIRFIINNKGEIKDEAFLRDRKKNWYEKD